MDHSKVMEDMYEEAAICYNESQRAYLTSTDPDKPRAKTLRDVMNQYKGQLNLATLSRRAKGLVSIQDFNRQKCTLSVIEAEVLIDHCLAEADRGFPFTNETLKERATEILKARCLRQGTEFAPLGKNWATTFLARHSKQISTYWSSSLHQSRARAVNQNTTDGWFKLVARAQKGDFSNGVPITDPALMCGVDESGFIPGIRAKHLVIGRSGQNGQYEVSTGNRESVTVICAIFGDGSSMTPTAIFKGAKIQSRWGQTDPDHNITNAQ